MSPTDYRVCHTAEGWRLEPPDPSSEPLNRFLQRCALRGLAEGSGRTYAYDLLALLRWAGGRALQTVGREQIYELIAEHRRILSPSTINRRIRVMNAYARFCRGEDEPRRTSRRPRRADRPGLPLVREPQVHKSPLAFEQVRALWLHLRTLRDQAMVGLMWTSGLRIGEVLALRIGDVDFDRHTLELLGKGRKPRLVPMAPWVGRLLHRYMLEERPRSARAELFLVMKGPRRGEPLSYAGARRLFRYHREKLNLPQAHPHRLRHTFAANMIRNGVSLPMLMRMLGHAWPSTALRYVCFDDQQMREDYEKALRTIRGAAEGL